MALTTIKKGLTLPIAGEPKQVIEGTKNPKKVAVIGYDYVGMKPTMIVQVGDEVKLGQLLFTDKKMPSVRFTSPGAGKVIEINRGEKRVFESLVIELSGNDEETFKSFSENELADINADKVKELLLESGLWTAIRQRPFGKVANPDETPRSLFITALDTNPLAPDMNVIMEGNEKHFQNGVTALSKLTSGKVFVCKSPALRVELTGLTNVEIENFSGIHPAGNVGTHIHFLDPVNSKKIVWNIDLQDVIAIGKFLVSGKLSVERVISLAGPSVKNPRLVKTRVGASMFDITGGELKEGENRIISGSVLSGRKGNEVLGYLGRYHQQISVIPEETKREFLGWLTPGFNLFSVKRILGSVITPKKKFNFTTSLNGGPRAIVPVGSYEKVMPLDIIPTYLLRALAVDDIEEAEKLGCMELIEEDLALCTYVCPSKIDHGINLRRNLTTIEKEG
ncbi:MAG: Na(+)-translocating NADH-quinone reductase subunit A [Bacteroidetes bacterium]|nr:Na(+)-translocating NADH-quinone reductase subunit A [Bacteroidota bacterium]